MALNDKIASAMESGLYAAWDKSTISDRELVTGLRHVRNLRLSDSLSRAARKPAKKQTATATLTRGQKAAATRKRNAAKRAKEGDKP